MDRVQAHQVLTEHLPATDWRWSGLRRYCVQCGRSYPCATQRAALDVLTTTKRLSPQTEVIMMTAYGTIETAVTAMRAGAFDFVTKPFGMNEQTWARAFFTPEE